MKIKFITYPCPNGNHGFSQQDRLKLRNAISKMVKANEMMKDNKKIYKTKSRAKRLANKHGKLPPHCEMQMLQCLSTLESKSIWNVISCSKRPCFACAENLSDSDICFEESHGKIYHQNFLEAEAWIESNERAKLAVRSLRDNAVRKVRGCDLG